MGTNLIELALQRHFGWEVILSDPAPRESEESTICGQILEIKSRFFVTSLLRMTKCRCRLNTLLTLFHFSHFSSLKQVYLKVTMQSGEIVYSEIGKEH